MNEFKVHNKQYRLVVFKAERYAYDMLKIVLKIIYPVVANVAQNSKKNTKLLQLFHWVN